MKVRATVKLIGPLPFAGRANMEIEIDEDELSRTKTNSSVLVRLHAMELTVHSRLFNMFPSCSAIVVSGIVPVHPMLF
jgi:hypothetical protein